MRGVQLQGLSYPTRPSGYRIEGATPHCAHKAETRLRPTLVKENSGEMSDSKQHDTLLKARIQSS